MVAIDVDNPRVRRVLKFIAIMAAIFIIIYAYALFLNSQSFDEMNEKICKDKGDTIDLNMLGKYESGICDCNRMENLTMICKYNRSKALAMSRELREWLK